MGLLIGVLCCGLACSDPEASEPTALATAPTTATPAETAGSPSPTPVVTEKAVQAILSGSEEAVMGLVAFTEIACSPDTWPFPSCRPGEAAGATLPRLPFVGCEPSFLDETALRVVVRQIVVARSPEVFAVVATTALPGELFPLGPNVVVFATRPPVGIANRTAILAVIDDSGRIASLRTGCRATPEQLVASVPVAAPTPPATTQPAP